MFKQGSIVDEITANMEKKLLANQSEKQFGFSKVAKAIDLLKAAADIFDDAGMTKESKEVEDVLTSLINSIKV